MPVQYGQYSLANSRLVPKAPGLPLAETQRLLEVKQGLYNMADQFRENTTDLRDSGVALPGSQAALGELNNGLNETLKTLGSRPDLENVSREMGNMYKDYKRNLTPFLQEYQAYQKWSEDLNKNDKISSPETKQKYRTYALSMHQGVRRDPTTGAYVANFTPPDVVNDVDLPAKIDKWLSSVVAQQTGQESRVLSRDGMKYIESGGKTIRVTKEMLENAMASALSLDPDVKPYIGREVGFAAMSGKTPEERQALMEAKNKDLTDNMWRYAQKYLRNDQESKYKEYDSAQGSEAAKIKFGPSMQIGTTNAFQVDLPTKSPDELEKKINSIASDRFALGKDLERITAEIQKMPDGPEKVALNLDYARKQQQYQGLVTQENNYKSVGKNIRAAILSSAEVKANSKVINAANEQLFAYGIPKVTDKNTGEVYTPFEIINGATKYDRTTGKLEFKTFDGRMQTMKLSEDKYNKAKEALKFGKTSTGQDGMKIAMSSIGNYAVAQARKKIYEDDKNFQYSSKQLMFTPEMTKSFDILLSGNQAMKVFNMNNKEEENVDNLSKYKREITGVTFDDVNGTGTPSFTMRVDKGTKDGKTNYEYYTVQFPDADAQKMLMREAYFGTRPSMELRQWADYVTATSVLGINGKDLTNMKRGQEMIVPGANNMVLKVVGEGDPIIPTHARKGSGLYTVVGTKQNGEFVPLSIKSAGKAGPVIFDQSDSYSILKTLGSLKAASDLNQKGY